jgi:hypothetical protein
MTGLTQLIGSFTWGVIIKPYTMDELDAELQRVLGKKQ